MNTHTGQYAKLLHERWQKAIRGECLTAFFTVHESEMFSTFLDRLIPSLTGQKNCLRLRREDRITGPFAPFLDWTARKVWAENASPSEFLERAGVYPPLRPVFFTYLNQGYAEREEEIIPEELQWEMRSMRDAIWQTFRTANRATPLLIVIEEMIRLPYATLKALKNLFTSGTAFPALFIFSCDDRHPDPDDRKVTLCREIMTAAHSRTLNIHAVKKQITALPSGQPGRETAVEQGRDCLHFLALEDAKDILQRCRKKTLDGEMKLSADKECEMLTLLGDTHRLLGENDEALLIYQNLLTLGRECGDSRTMASAYRRIGASQFLRENTDRARLMANQSRQLAEESGDLKLIFEAELLLFLIEDKLRQMDIETWRVMNAELLQKAEILGWDNTRAFILTNQFGTFSKYSAEYRLQHDEGMKIGKELGNIYRVAAGYHIKGLIASVQGEYGKVIRYYRKSESIKKKLGNDLEMAYIKNGIGFYNHMTGSYGKALMRFSEAHTLLNRVREFHEIAMTWFNMAAACFLAQRNDDTIELLEAILSLLIVMETDNLAYHSKFGIYSFLGTAYARSGDMDRAYEYLTRIQVASLKPYPEKNEEYFFYFLLKALIADHEKKHARAEKLFQRSERYLLRTNDVISYMEAAFRLEFAQFYKQTGNSKESARQLALGKEASLSLEGDYYRQVYSRKQRLPLNPDPATSNFTYPDVQRVLEMCRTGQQMTRLHNRINEISFLNSFQLAMGGGELSEEEILDACANLIRNTFPIDGIFIHKFTDTKWVPVTALTRNTAIPDPEHNVIENLVNQEHRLLRSEMRNFPDITIPGRKAGTVISLPVRICGAIRYHILCRNDSDSSIIERESVRALTISASLLGNALTRLQKDLEIREANTKLKEMATSDTLTGLANRTALHRRLAEESRRYRRYTDENGPGFSIAFLDMDNFKYYNDTFGHLVGDRLLVLFANILKLICRDVDFIARYGGDEFILILPETEEDGAILLMKRLYGEISSQRNFKTALEGILGKSVEIPEERKLSFSSGIAVYSASYGDDIETLLNDADKALYHAKTAGKNSWKVYRTSDA